MNKKGSFRRLIRTIRQKKNEKFNYQGTPVIVKKGQESTEDNIRSQHDDSDGIKPHG